ncbi:SseB family protein [Actinoplanes sp. GCM10030250]|uniref:SseB family protein n=1 Tax=Actinoplanes sp. GCM10030250 TaxID=3273376 RepID=UPI00360DC6E2
MSEWDPATDAEVAMRDALRTDDQESYFRILAGVDLLLPVSADALAGRAPLGWGTWSTGGRTHVLAFTSQESLRSCLADYTGSARRVPYAELANTWPNLEWWLAVNPGLPIEGYLPAWFVAQLARGDLRLPTRGPGREAQGGSRIQELGAAALAASRGSDAPGGPTYDGVPPGAPSPITSGAGRGPTPGQTSFTPAVHSGNTPASPMSAPPSSGAPAGYPGTPAPGGFGGMQPATGPGGLQAPSGLQRPGPGGPQPPGGLQPPAGPGGHPGGGPQAPVGPGGLPLRTPTGNTPSGLPARAPSPSSAPGNPSGLPLRPDAPAEPPAAYQPPSIPRDFSAGPGPGPSSGAPAFGRPGSGAGAGAAGYGTNAPGWDKSGSSVNPGTSVNPGSDPRGSLPTSKGSLPVRTPMANTPPVPEHVTPYDPAETPFAPNWAAPSSAPPPAPPARDALPRRQPGQSASGGQFTSMAGFVPTGSASNATPSSPGFGSTPPAAGPAPAFPQGPASPQALAAHSGPAPGGSGPGGAGQGGAGQGGAGQGGAGQGGMAPGRNSLGGNPLGNSGPGSASGGSDGQGNPLPRRQVTPPSERPTSMAAAAQALGANRQPPTDPAPHPQDRLAPPAADRFGPSGPPPSIQPHSGPGSDDSQVRPALVPPVIPGVNRGTIPPGGSPVSGAPAPGYPAQSSGAGYGAPGYGSPAPGSPAPGYNPNAPVSAGPAQSFPSSPAPSYGTSPSSPAPHYGATNPSSPAPDYGAAYGAAYGSPAAASSAPPATNAPAFGAAPSGYGTPTPPIPGMPPQGSPAAAYATQAYGSNAFATQALPVASGGYGAAAVASGLGVAGSDTGSRIQANGAARRDQAAAEFVPANDVERDLREAADAGNTDIFLSTLLLANVLVPVASHSRPGSSPGESGFAFLPEEVEGERFLIVFTSKDRLSEHFGEPTRTVGVRFYELIRNWPDPAWSFAVNPGTPVGAKYPGAQIIALANWATEAGLGAEPVDGPISDGTAAPIPAPEPASDEAQQATVMQKTISAEQVDYYLDRGYDRIAGFVHRASEVEHLRTPVELFGALGLNYESSPFQQDAKEAFVLRWPAYRPSLYRIPYGGQNEQALRAMDGWVIERPPFRGNGFAPGESKDVIAEFKVDSVRLPHGAQLWRIDADGDERMLAIYDADGPLWRRVGEQ